MAKRIFSCLLLLTFLTTIIPTFVSQAEGAQGESFKFIHFTDTHVGSGKGNKNTPLAIQDIVNYHPDAAFVVHGGDLTELGMPSEYEYYNEMIKPLKMPIYHTLGNHESRWTDAGKSIYKEYIGEPYTSWDYQGIHFVTLDTSIAQGQHGHLEKTMLQWLKDDLAKISKNMPVIILGHHPIFFDETYDASKFMDNDWDLWQVIKNYNVRAIFTGHGHKDLIWTMNDVTGLMTNAVMDDDGSYSVIEIDNKAQELVVYNRSFQTKAVQEFTRISLKKPKAQRSIDITAPIPNSVLANNMVLQAELSNWEVEPQKVEYKLEDFSWKPLEKTGDSYTKEIDLTEIDNGIRTFWVRAVDTAGKVYLDRVTINIQKDDKPKILWQFEAQGSIQHAPIVTEKYLYFADNSGSVYQLEQQTGTKKWEFKTGGAIIGSPVFVKGKIYVGSADGKVYALKATSGEKIWEYETGGAVIATPIVAAGKVFVGSSDFNMYALGAATGKEVWKFSTGNTIMNSATYGNDTVFFGSWDQKFYAVDANTGQEKWSKELGSRVYYAPAASAPLFYKGRVIISAPSSKAYAFDSLTGEKLWEVSAASGLSTPIIFNHAVVYNTTSGTLYALDPETGENVWQNDTRNSTYVSSPLAYGGDIILSGLKGKVVSVNTGEEAYNWSINLGETYLFSKGAANGNLLFFGTFAGKVFGIKGEASPKPQPFPLMAAFPDTIEHWARRDLNKLAKSGLIKGYADGSFKPDEPVNRAEMAVMLSRYLKYEESAEYQTTFTDINGHWAAKPIIAMEEKNIVSGYQDKDKFIFMPEKKISRAEAVVMLARALNLYVPSEGFSSKFADIENHWAKDAIMALEEKGIISGYTEDDKVLFKPDQSISRAEIGVLLVRVEK